LRKPMPGKRREDFALVRYGRGHDHVVRGNAVRGHQPDFFLPGINVADFATAQKFDTRLGQSIGERIHARILGPKLRSRSQNPSIFDEKSQFGERCVDTLKESALSTFNNFNLINLV